ncbi:MAG: formate/nitrite transporter family protein [Phycisphaerales bacterium]|jgi:formate/nitrite transporter FocA (FNT family)
MATDQSSSQREEDSQEQEDAAPGVTGEPTTGTRLTAWQIYHNVRIAAEEEMERPPGALFWSALASGLTIGFSFLAAAYLESIAPVGLKPAAGAAGYPLGFIFVVLARNQLFTENTLEPVIPLLHSRSLATLRSLLILWVVVLVGNLIGTAVFALLMAETIALHDPALDAAMAEVARKATVAGFVPVFYQAIYGGWLIALMAWLLASTRATGAQILIVWMTTAPISAFGFRHSIAGAVEAFYLAWTGVTGWEQALLGFILPAVIGNIVGGVLLVALLNHGQIKSGRRAKQESP